LVYLFEHDDKQIEVESKYVREDGTYLIYVRKPDGTSTQERFSGETLFRSRLDEIYVELEQGNWRVVGPPQFQKDGWRI
jgi:hypothetical protein